MHYVPESQTRITFIVIAKAAKYSEPVIDTIPRTFSQRCSIVDRGLPQPRCLSRESGEPQLRAWQGLESSNLIKAGLAIFAKLYVTCIAAAQLHNRHQATP